MTSAGQRTAAVLIPLCNVDSQAGILFELRGKLRHHAGEVSFPGGKVDPEDGTTLATALRETHEEIGVAPDRVEVLGRIGPSTLSLGGLRVFPYVGFIHASPIEDPSHLQPSDEPLPNISPKNLTLSPDEVIHAFHQPFSSLVDSRRIRPHAFRGQTPYYAVDVTDEFEGSGVNWAPSAGIDETGASERPGRLEIWGLTGWYLNIFMQRMGLYQ